jgi:hybrid cluster-associated redox disulfide protein
MTLDENMPLEEVMRRWPATIRVFLNYRMHCIGCPISSLHTARDAAREHGVELDRFLADLRNAAGTGPTPPAGPGAVFRNAEA